MSRCRRFVRHDGSTAIAVDSARVFTDRFFFFILDDTERILHSSFSLSSTVFTRLNVHFWYRYFNSYEFMTRACTTCKYSYYNLRPIFSFSRFKFLFFFPLDDLSPCCFGSKCQVLIDRTCKKKGFFFKWKYFLFVNWVINRFRL